MDSHTLFDSYTLGSDRAYKSTDIGKFGVGGVKASLQTSTVKHTITKDSTGTLRVRSFDLKEVREMDEWQTSTSLLDLSEAKDFWDQYSTDPESSGTVIILKAPKMDQGSDSQISKVKASLSSIFVEPITREQVKISLNGVTLTPHCPAGSDLPVAIVSKKLPIELDGVHVGSIQTVDTSAVPVDLLKKSLGSTQATEYGLYFCRGERFLNTRGLWAPDIQLGKLAGRNAHYRDAKVIVSFETGMDTVFNVSSDKTGVSLSQGLGDKIWDIIRDLLASCSKRQQNKKKREVTADSLSSAASRTKSILNSPRLTKTIHSTKKAAKVKSGNTKATTGTEGSITRLTTPTQFHWLSEVSYDHCGTSADLYELDVLGRHLKVNTAHPLWAKCIQNESQINVHIALLTSIIGAVHRLEQDTSEETAEEFIYNLNRIARSASYTLSDDNQ